MFVVPHTASKNILRVRLIIFFARNIELFVQFSAMHYGKLFSEYYLRQREAKLESKNVCHPPRTRLLRYLALSNNRPLLGPLLNPAGPQHLLLAGKFISRAISGAIFQYLGVLWPTKTPYLTTACLRVCLEKTVLENQHIGLGKNENELVFGRIVPILIPAVCCVK